jgi:nucleoside-diphosphate-sugar epimerase
LAADESHCTNYAASVPRKALIAGAAGFIGSHLSELLIGDGWEVYALDDLSTESDANVFQLAENSHFHLTVESVLATSVVSDLVHKCDVIFHLPAAVGVRLLVERPGHTLLTNVRRRIEAMFQRIPSIDKIRAAIGWAPPTDVDGILAEVIEHSRLQPARVGSIT